MNTRTLDLLQIIGSPFVKSNKKPVNIDADKLYDYSRKNRMPLLYLKSLSAIKGYEEYGEECKKLSGEWVNIEERIKKVIGILRRANISYVTFKSIKPYREVTVDIDLLIINSYWRAVTLLQESGYALLQIGPLSSTFRDPAYRIDYDIYDEVGVSHIIYYDKGKVSQYIYNKPLVTGGHIISLTPEADLLAVIAHSVIKEQMYVLAEYYSTLHYLREMDESSLDNFIEMVETLKLHNAVRAHMGITNWLHKDVHGLEAPPLRRIEAEIGVDDLEVKRLRKSMYKMPHKFHPLTLMRSFSDKLIEKETRRSFAAQFLSMTSPSFLKKFLPDFIGHVLRETY